MRKSLFYFISVFFLSLTLFPWLKEFSSDGLDQSMVALIFLLGIPHGAIDNILMKRRTGWSNSQFYAFYLGLIGLNVVLWFVLPALSLLLFLIVSAYHFGQAQLSHYFKRKTWFLNLLYLSWGSIALSSFFLFRRVEISSYFSELEAFEQLSFLSNKAILTNFFLVSLVVFLSIFAFCIKKKLLGSKNLAMEILVLFMVMTIAYLYHFIMGFAIFFVLLHAIPVMLEEYEEFYTRFQWRNLFSFAKMLTPFTLFSIIGILLLFGLKYYEVIQLSNAFIVLLAGSSITLPHVWVMKKFYKE